jgi:hypothetical protein
MARITQHLSGGKLIDHLPHWMRPPMDPADDMIMKFRSLSEAWKVKRLNEEVSDARSSKHSRGTDRRGRDES